MHLPYLIIFIEKISISSVVLHYEKYYVANQVIFQ